jgi:membrane associated rhomboid family serine protease
MSYVSSPWQLPPVVKNLLIINALICLAYYVVRSTFGLDINDIFGMYYWQSEEFGIWQFVTFQFMHGGFEHMFFNMFAVFMFGRVLESVWGAKRFLKYYLITGIGSGLIQQVALYFDINPIFEAIDAYLSNPSTEGMNVFLSQFPAFNYESAMALSDFTNRYNAIVNQDMVAANALARDFLEQYSRMFVDAHITVGASGAVFGLLLAFGMLFPNQIIMLMIPPIPIKAKYFVIIYGAIELFAGIGSFGYDNVAHWAHLGGMLFGFFLIRRWKRNNDMYGREY